jgi:nitrate/TMAO reductase-like tetraheme cytochrome c subunit
MKARFLAIACGALALTCGASAPATAQTTASRCADCHFAQNPKPAPEHLADWDRSPHRQSGVGCEKCHGGDATVFESTLAHRGVLPSADRKSPVYRANLPATCGSCHTGPYAAFQSSRHYELLKGDDRRGPTCSTCHTAVSGTLLSPSGLESRCASCHGPGEIVPRARRATNARTTYQTLSWVRGQFKDAESRIRKVDDPRRRAELESELEEARAALTRATEAGHKFVYDDLLTYAAVAQQRVEALVSRLRP